MGAFLALLLMQMLTAAVAHQQNHFFCPKNCHCVSTFRADCSGLPDVLWDDTLVLNVTSAKFNNLQNISMGKVTSNLRVLYFTDNKVESISAFAFRELSQLRFLICDRNEIVNIHPNAFSEMKRLESLSLQSNDLHLVPLNVTSRLRFLKLSSCKITELPKEVFIHLLYLEDLQLSSNLLQTLDGTSFCCLTNLKYLSLNKNLLVSLENDTFSMLSNLTVLDLSWNKIQHLSSFLFYNLSKLDTLYLSHNELQYISINVFDPLTNLKNLYLEFNQLEYLEANVFTNLINLRYLFLGNNVISEIDRKVFTNLRNVTHLSLSSNSFTEFNVCSVQDMDQLMYLYLFGQNLLSDCDLWNMWKWSAEHDVNLMLENYYTDNGNKIFLNKNCNVTDCSDIIDIVDLGIPFLFYVIGISVTCSLLLILIIVCCCLRYRKKMSKRKPVQFIGRNTYDIVAEYSHSTTETEAIQVYEYHSSNIAAAPQRNCNGSYTEQVRAIKSHRPIGPVYSTSEEEEEALLMNRRQQSLRIPRQQKRVLPRPTSVNSPNELKIYHFSDTEPQSSTLSDYSDSNCDMTEPSTQGLV